MTNGFYFISYQGTKKAGHLQKITGSII